MEAGVARAKEWRLSEADEKRVSDLEHTVYGNSKPGLKADVISLTSYLKGAAAVGGVLMTLVVLMLSFVLSSIKDLEKAVGERPVVVTQSVPK
jgi:hypothetical protein